MTEHDALLARAVDAVWALVPAALVFGFTVDSHGLVDRTAAVRGRGDTSVDRFIELMRRLEPIDPFSPRRAQACNAALVSAAELGGEQRLGNSLYRGHLVEHGYGSPIFMYLRRDGVIVAGVALLREHEAPAFEPAATQMLRRLIPLLEQSLRITGAGRARERAAEAATARLTAREREVAGLVADGSSNADIAHALAMSQATVKAHLTKIYAKVGVRTRTQLAVAFGGAGIKTFG